MVRDCEMKSMKPKFEDLFLSIDVIPFRKTLPRQSILYL